MGEVLCVRGGRPLAGTVQLPAAKNSVLPLLAAGLLCSGPVELCGVPGLADVSSSLALLQGLGCGVQYTGGRLRLDPAGLAVSRLPEGPARAMRSSVFYLAPLLHALGQVTMPLPGGCNLGPRPVDIHLDGLVQMGARVCLRDDRLTLTAPRGLHGVDYTLRLPSVGATETLLMAASRAAGTTVLRGAACEPEVIDLAAFLLGCGAKITGAGTPVIVVQGVPQLAGLHFAPLPDRIVAATLAAAAASAGGWVRMQNCRPRHLAPVLELLAGAGCQVTEEDGALLVARDPGSRLHGAGTVCTGVYPAFPTDAAPLAAAALLTAVGETLLDDCIFEHRFACAAGFAALGARAECRGRALYIQGTEQLTGAAVTAPDLRGGAALVLAALAARGESRVGGLGHIQRGYEDLGGLLASLGADITLQTE